MTIGKLTTEIKALVFDVGGSVFDWKSAIINRVNHYNCVYKKTLDPVNFAMTWRLNMFLTLGQVHQGKIEHCSMNHLLSLALHKTLSEFATTATPDVQNHFMAAWNEMDVWDEFPSALQRMKSKYKVCVLSVLSLSILINSSKYSAITWDGLVSCEFLSCYKQKPEAYLEGAALLGLKPEEICFVAVHPSDLISAGKTGMKKAYVEPKDNEPDVPGLVLPFKADDYDYVAESYQDLCDQLGC